MKEAGIFERYDGLIFDRTLSGPEAHRRVVGVGLKLFDRALRAGREAEAIAASLPGLSAPILVFRARDRVTVDRGMVRQTVISAVRRQAGFELLRDWELLQFLNTIGASQLRSRDTEKSVVNLEVVLELVETARLEVQENLERFNLPFRVPEIELTGVLWPN